jgi:hypothetical protein
MRGREAARERISNRRVNWRREFYYTSTRFLLRPIKSNLIGLNVKPWLILTCIELKSRPIEIIYFHGQKFSFSTVFVLRVNKLVGKVTRGGEF